MLRRTTLVVGIALTTYLSGCDNDQRTSRTRGNPDIFAGWHDTDTSRPLMALVSHSTGKEYQIHVPKSAEVTIDGVVGSFDQLKKGMEIQLVMRDKTVIKVEATSPR
jgi:hypothetical protein